MAVREVSEGLQRQGIDEFIPYRVNVSRWATSPTDPIVVAYNATSWEDVSDDILDGTPIVDGVYIVTPLVGNLVLGELYKIVVTFSEGSTVRSCYFRVLAEV
jgi:hypothetical protein